ncbi:Crp/Fnr family transcriptional regulator [Candidatus Saccharibacteria bacterium]|nr:Crp/Fnr family transcriptional regulator [Candidatus Saccharibacteria bacterium]
MTHDTPHNLEQFFSDHTLRRYPKGQILLYAGDPPSQAYLLLVGTVSQYDESYKGDKLIINTFKPGACLPMLPAVSGLANRYFYEADTDIEVRQAPLDETLAFIRSDPALLYDLLKRVYIGLDGVLGRMLQLMAGSARSRLLYELLIECRRFGEQRTDGSYFIAIHESDLAARSGLTRETISREIHKASQEGMITVGRQGIAIADIDWLQQQLEGRSGGQH